MSFLDDWVNKFHGSDEIDSPGYGNNPLIDQQLAINRPDQSSPFGGTRWVQNEPMSQLDWIDSLGYDRTKKGWARGEHLDDRYQQYLKHNKSQETYYSPELQSVFDKVFTPDAYDNYATEYMGNYNELIDPYRQRETDRFQQSMFDRGLPEGSEVYGDAWRPIGDQRSRSDLMAGQTAMGIADNRRTTDFNQLMAAMGQNTLPIPQIDVMGPANLEMNRNMFNSNLDMQSKANFHKAVSDGIGAFFGGNSFGGS